MSYKDTGIHAVILAAGKGSRMKSNLPKCACNLYDKPFISHLIDSCKKSYIDDINVVVGYKKEEMFKIVPNDINICVQEKQLGTGNAAYQCKESLIEKGGITIIFPGDMPLFEVSTMDKLVRKHIKSGNDLTFVTTELDNPYHYGRIYRENGRVKKIIEYKDCSAEQKKIREINVGVYCVDNKLLFEALEQLNPINKAGEYYLTDIVEILDKRKKKVDTFIVKSSYHLIGINDIDTLRKVENLMMEEIK